MAIRLYLGKHYLEQLMSRKDLAKKIKLMRQEYSWSQAQLAEIANLSLRTIQRVENSGYCSHETLLSIAAAFELDVQELTALIYKQNKNLIFNMGFIKNIISLRGDIIMTISKLGIAVIVTGLLYVVLLLGITAIGATAFHQFYESLPTEAQLNAEYRLFLYACIVGLALFLGIWSAIFGVWRQRIWQGILALGGGVFLTIGMFSVLPWIQYPHDQYPASFEFVFGGMLPCLFSWITVTVVGKYLNRKGILNHILT